MGPHRSTGPHDRRHVPRLRDGRRSGVATLLADADTYGGSVAQVLGLLDESPGLAAACRAVSTGSLDLAVLAQAAREVSPNLRVLTGIVRADRWPELRPAALAEVWARARFLAALTVVDCGFALEQDEELSYDTLAPRRNGATLATLEAADLVLAVGRADPVGSSGCSGPSRGARGGPQGRGARGPHPRTQGPVGRDPESQLSGPSRVMRESPRPCSCQRTSPPMTRPCAGGRGLHEVAARSSARAALAALAVELVEPAPRRRRRRRAGH